jgi:hypothetical protein
MNGIGPRKSRHKRWWAIHWIPPNYGRGTLPGIGFGNRQNADELALEYMQMEWKNANHNIIQNKSTQTPGSIQPISIRCEKNVPSE